MHPAISQRNRILKEQNLTLVHVFDTNQHEPDKDVCRIEDARGVRMILRVGEVRPKGVFEDGYQGRVLVVPKRFAHGDNPAWELEEDLDAPELIAVEPEPFPEGSILNPDLQEKMVAAFWEMQTAWTGIGLPQREQKVLEHAKGALALLPGHQKMTLLKITKVNEAFLHGSYPSKWKFSKDNILLLEDGRLGLVDLSGVGLRHWGYDIGWIYWPQWYQMRTAQWADIAGYVERIEALFDQVVAMKPPEVDLEPAETTRRLWLGFLTRVVGGYFDIAEYISHARAIAEDEDRRKVFLAFLDGLLDEAIARIDS